MNLVNTNKQVGFCKIPKLARLVLSNALYNKLRSFLRPNPHMLNTHAKI